MNKIMNKPRLWQKTSQFRIFKNILSWLDCGLPRHVFPLWHTQNTAVNLQQTQYNQYECWNQEL